MDNPAELDRSDSLVVPDCPVLDLLDHPAFKAHQAHLEWDKQEYPECLEVLAQPEQPDHVVFRVRLAHPESAQALVSQDLLAQGVLLVALV